MKKHRHLRRGIAAVASALAVVFSLGPVTASVRPPPLATDVAEPGALVPLIAKLPVGALSSATAVAAPSLPPATEIGPGSHLFMSRPDGLYACTANFVWQSGGTTYLGAAGHCFLQAGQVATHGPGADANTSNVRVQVCVADCYFGGQPGFVFRGQLVNLGAVAYARQSFNGDVRGYDFGIVAVPASLASRVRPSMPVWGGPTSIAPDGLLGPVCHYGYGEAVGAAFPTQARTGLGIAKSAKSWNGDLAALFGDSGSAVVTCGASTDGFRGSGAVGLITHLTSGTSITLGTTVGQAITLAREAGLSLSLVMGT